jgi:hypothetical protein
MPEEHSSPAGRCVLILGMHRSGTSLLAGTLGAAGLYLGRVLDAPFSLNPTGLQEPEVLIRMHEDLLEANGGAWHDPPAQVVWGRLHCTVRDLFIESRAGRPLWGFKEPRTLLVAEGWIEALPAWTAVGIFRHPAEVVASLAHRNGFAPDRARALWCAYNRRLLSLQQRHGFPVVEFSADPARMRPGLSRALAWLGLPEPAAGRLFDAGLPRHTAASEAEAVPQSEAVQTLLDGLRAAAAAPTGAR